MLWTVISVLVVLWLIGLLVPAIFSIIGNFIHIILVVALIVFVVQIIKGRR